ncbi:hypothetical protein D9M71_504900 [compost metagenome]
MGTVEGAVPLLVHSHLAGGHALDGAVVVVHRQHRFLLEQHVEDLLGLLGILGALVDAGVVGGRRPQVVHGVERHHLALEVGRRLEERLPAFLQLAALHLGAVVAVAGGAPQVGHGVVVVLVVGQNLELVLQVGEVRQLRLVELLQQAFLDEDLDEAVRRHHHVIGATAGLELGQQCLVAVVGIQGGLDAGVLLELLQQLRREVIRPVGEVQGAFGVGLAGERQSGEEGKRERGAAEIHR